jgi:hypothetical protein
MTVVIFQMSLLRRVKWGRREMYCLTKNHPKFKSNKKGSRSSLRNCE